MKCYLSCRLLGVPQRLSAPAQTLCQLVAAVNILLSTIAQFAPHFVVQNTFILQWPPALLVHIPSGCFKKSLIIKTITLICSLELSVLDLQWCILANRRISCFTLFTSEETYWRVQGAFRFVNTVNFLPFHSALPNFKVSAEDLKRVLKKEKDKSSSHSGRNFLAELETYPLAV